MIRISARAACCAFVVSFAAFTAGAHAAANPMGLAYKTTTNVALYAKPTGLIIAGRCNRYDPAFANVRSKGGEVLAYLHVTARPDRAACALDTGFYMGDVGAVPLWPYPTYGQRSIYANTRLPDIRAGSKWILHVVAYIEKLMRENKVDGVFLDAVGARPYSTIAEWSSWSMTEKNAYTAGLVDLVRRLDAKRRAIRPSFIIINNGKWDRRDGNTIGLAGERYVDGVMMEQPPGLTAFHKNYINRPFGNLGHRRTIVLANTRTEAVAWSKISGVTHVGSQSTFTYPPTPVVSFKALDDR